MINLKDYLASLVIGVNQARMLADFESARIAKIYAQDDLLKTFAVPHFRIPDMELDIPVAIDQLEQEPVKDYQPIADNTKFNALTYQIVKDTYKVTSFEGKISRKIRTQIAHESATLEMNLKKEYNKDLFLKEYNRKIVQLTEATLKEYKQQLNIKDTKDEAISEQLIQNLDERLASQIKPITYKNDISNAKVVVEAHKLREFSTNNIINIKMKISEEGMEWHKVENADGENKMKLLPE